MNYFKLPTPKGERREFMYVICNLIYVETKVFYSIGRSRLRSAEIQSKNIMFFKIQTYITISFYSNLLLTVIPNAYKVAE